MLLRPSVQDCGHRGECLLPNEFLLNSHGRKEAEERGDERGRERGR